MTRFISVLRMYLCLFRIARNPESTAAGIAIADRLRELNLLEAEREAIMSDPDSAILVRRRKLLGKVDLPALNQLADGTLGKVFSTHMLRLGLVPEFYKVIDVDDDISFGMMCLRQTHDLWHILTGFDTSVPGELGLQAFMCAQTMSPLAPLLIGGRLFAGLLKDPKEFPLILDNVARGWILGKNSKRLFAIDWEQNWSTPLIELQEKYLRSGGAVLTYPTERNGRNSQIRSDQILGNSLGKC